jgi:thiamine biosynthesis lipoprotein
MGTIYTIKVVTENELPEPVEDLKSAIDAELLRINKLMSTWDPESELSRFNAHPSSQPFPVSGETLQVVKAAKDLFVSTQGLYDPTVGPLVDLWGFGPKPRRTEPPTVAEIEAATSIVGMDWLLIDESSGTLSKSIPELHLDLSSIAKGYGVDAVCKVLGDRGYQNFMVEIGGEIAVWGLNRNGEPWSLGIDSPNQTPDKRELIHTLSLTDAAVATSGDYRNKFEFEGVQYTHVLNPKTGWPVPESVKSVTVIAPSCMRADGAATAIMVLGATEGHKWARNQPDLEALILYLGAEGGVQEVQTTGMREYSRN